MLNVHNTKMLQKVPFYKVSVPTYYLLLFFTPKDLSSPFIRMTTEPIEVSAKLFFFSSAKLLKKQAVSPKKSLLQASASRLYLLKLKGWHDIVTFFLKAKIINFDFAPT